MSALLSLWESLVDIVALTDKPSTEAPAVTAFDRVWLLLLADVEEAPEEDPEEDPEDDPAVVPVV